MKYIQIYPNYTSKNQRPQYLFPCNKPKRHTLSYTDLLKLSLYLLSKHIIICRSYLLYCDWEVHMYYILLSAQQTATQAANTAQEVATQAPSNDIIGIGGIIATLLVGIVTCLVTWKLTMKSIKQLKISYNIQVFPILSNSVTKSTDINLDDLKIQYKDKELLNPCLLALEIVNIGNEAINEPPIKIRADEDIEIIPGYFEDIPAGYEDLWSFDKTDPNSCNILLKHINPKQVVKTRFFLDNLPQKKIIFECPMQNVQTQEAAYNNINTANKITVSSKSNIILMVITALLFISMERWGYYISEFIWFTGIHLRTSEAVAFIMSLLLLTIIINVYGVPVADKYIKSHPKRSMLIKLALAIVSIILLMLIIFDYIIIGFIPQITTAIIVIVLLSLLIHFSFISKNT